MKITSPRDLINNALQELLDECDDHPEDIAAYLSACGFKGRRRDPCGCPLANYLLDRTRIASVRVYQHDDGGPGEIAWDQYCEGICRYPLPAALNEFVKRFDDGAYPELVDVDD